MRSGNISYAAIQFSAEPERFEALNVGVVLFDHATKRMVSKTTEDYSRLNRFFGKVNKTFLNLAIEEFVSRLSSELLRGNQEALDRFVKTRANNLRITPFLPLNVANIEDAQQDLFDELVGTVPHKKRSTRVGTKLKSGLKALEVLRFFDVHPEAVTLPRYNVVLTPDLAIRNNHYQLIEAVRFDDPDTGFTAAGTQALAGRALHANRMSTRLVVVGEFGDQPQSFYNAVREDLHSSHVKLFRMDNLREFADEIIPPTLH